jgi:NAD(P)-dependent dehydrogenase (short-subunit alcohol dehydrogenase family)
MIHDEIIWVTGASSGIGEALALQLAAGNNRVLVSARDPLRLNTLAQASKNIEVLPCDITDKDALAATAQIIAERYGYLDRVIINAGTCEYFEITEPDWEMARRVMEVNFFGAINTAAAALPLLQKSLNQKAGRSAVKPHMVLIASLASVVPFPRSEAYGASKAAVQYFFEALRIDLARQNIAVTVVQPGFVETPLTAKNDFPMPFLLKVDYAARVIADRIADYPHLVRFPGRLSVLLYSLRLFPGLWHWIAVRLLRRSIAQEV